MINTIKPCLHNQAIAEGFCQKLDKTLVVALKAINSALDAAVNLATRSFSFIKIEVTYLYNMALYGRDKANILKILNKAGLLSAENKASVFQDHDLASLSDHLSHLHEEGRLNAEVLCAVFVQRVFGR